MGHETGQLVIDAVTFVVVAVAAYTDARWNKIYNLLTFPAMAAGVVLNAVFAAYGAVDGLKFSGLGLVVGLALLAVPFALGGTKAGDVKLLMAVGALKGWIFVGTGFLYGAAIFGIGTVPILALRGKLGPVCRNIGAFFFSVVVLRQNTEIAPPADQMKFPYGIALGIGIVIAMVLEHTLGRPYFWNM